MATSIPQQLQVFLASQTPSQLAVLATAIDEIQNSQHYQQVAATSIQAPKHKAVKTSKGHVKSRGKMAHQPPKKEPVAKRPLNSFIAFRSYYKAIFQARQQKDISGYLNQLWNADPYRAKWTIIAKAYSIIRDTIGRRNASLPQFLAIAVEHIGIIPPVLYPGLMGWIVPSGNEREMRRRFVADIRTFPAYWQQATDMSVDDLLRICEDAGYYSASPANGKPTEQAHRTVMLTCADVATTITNDELTMAVNANASPVAQATNHIEGGVNIGINGSDNVVDTTALPKPIQAMGFDNFVTSNELVPSEMDVDQASMSAFSGVVGVNPPAGAQINNYLLDMSEDSYPFNDQFEPEDAAHDKGLYFEFGDEFDDTENIGVYESHWEVDFDAFLNYNGLTTDQA